jgi:hypothetical protein
LLTFTLQNGTLQICTYICLSKPNHCFKACSRGQFYKNEVGNAKVGILTVFAHQIGDLKVDIEMQLCTYVKIDQGCQMIYFQTTIPILGKLWLVLNGLKMESMYVGLFYGHLVNFMVIWYIFDWFRIIFPFLVHMFKKINLATLAMTFRLAWTHWNLRTRRRMHICMQVNQIGHKNRGVSPS